MSSITSPSGRVFNWTKDTPPTEEDLQKMYAIDAREGAVKGPPRLGGKYSDGKPQFEGTGLPTIARYGPPVIAAAVAPPSALGFLATGVVAGASELGARALEGKSVTDREAAGDAVGAFANWGTPAPGLKAVHSLKDFLWQGAKAGAASAATELLSTTAANTIKSKELKAYDSVWAGLTHLSTAAALSGGAVSIADGLRGTLSTIGSPQYNHKTNPASPKYDPEVVAQTIEGRRGLYQEIGNNHPAFGLLDSSNTALMYRVAENGGIGSESVRKELGRGHQDMYEAFRANYPKRADSTNEEIGKVVNPMLGEVDRLEKASREAREIQKKVVEAEIKIKEDATLPREQKRDLLTAARAEFINATQAAARTDLEAMAKIGPATSTSAQAEALGRSLKGLDKVRTDAYDHLMDLADIPGDIPLYSVNQMRAAAAAALERGHNKGDSKNTTGLAILSAIEEAAVSKATQPILDASGKAIAQDKLLTGSELKELRSKMGSKFGTTADKDRSLSDGMISKAYGAIREESFKTLDGLAAQGVLRPEQVASFNKAREFWAETSKMEQSTLGQALMGGSNMDSTARDAVISGLATRMAAGQVADVKAFKEFVGAVAKGEEMLHAGDPLAVIKAPTAAMAIETMKGAIRNAFIEKHTDGGVLQVKSLLKDLTDAGAKSDALPFPVESLRFGNKEFIKNWSGVMEDLGPKQRVTPQMYDQFVSNPEIQRAMVHGGSGVKATITRALAEATYSTKVREAAMLKIANANPAAVRRAERAAEQSAAAIKDAAVAKKLFDEARADPMLAALGKRQNGLIRKSPTPLTNAPGVTEGPGSVLELFGNLSSENRRHFMQGLWKTNKQHAEMFEGRLIADSLEKVMVPDKMSKPGSKMIDTEKLRNYFNPAMSADAPRRMLQQGVRPEIFANIDRFAKDYLKANDRLARTGSHSGHSNLVGLGAASAPVPGTGPIGRMAAVNRAQKVVESGYYHTLAFWMQNPGPARSSFEAGAALGTVFGSLPAQKVFNAHFNPDLMNELGALYSSEKENK